MTSDRFGLLRVFCEPLASNLLSARDIGTELDPCAGYDCGGGGECVPMNGNPTCRCGELGALVERVRGDGTQGPVCETFEPPPMLIGEPPETEPETPLQDDIAGDASVPTDGGGGGDGAEDTPPAGSSGLCSIVPPSGRSGAGILLLLAMCLWWRGGRHLRSALMPPS